jgi:hypothetical protein
MKKISFVIAAVAVISLSSCYVETRDGNRYHHPFWHHRDVVVVGENNIKQNNHNNTVMPDAVYEAKK